MAANIIMRALDVVPPLRYSRLSSLSTTHHPQQLHAWVGTYI